MFRKTKIALAAGVGYVLGARAGRARYDTLLTTFGSLRRSTAEKASAAADTASGAVGTLRSAAPSAPAPATASAGTAAGTTAPAAPVEPVPEGVEVYPQAVVDRRHGADVTDVTHLPAETDPLEITADFYEENPPA